MGWIAPAPPIVIICHNNHSSSERGYPYILLPLCCHNFTYIIMSYEMEQKLILLPAMSYKVFTEKADEILSAYFSAGWHIAQINGVTHPNRHFPYFGLTSPMFAAFILLERSKKDYHLDNHQR